LAWVVTSSSAAGQARLAPPKEGYVPNEETAVRIAEAVLVPIYGEGQVRSEQPFRARLVGKIWLVTGTLKPDAEGGTAEVRISRASGEILSVKHGK
jgi:NTF2 fold immunity protein